MGGKPESFREHSRSNDAIVKGSNSIERTTRRVGKVKKKERLREKRDCEKFLTWLTTRNSFLVPDANLLFLSNGLVSIIRKDDVNCEQAEEIGQNIQKSLDGVAITNASIKRKDLTKPLESLMEVKKAKSGIDLKVMFNRMITVAEREESLEQFFEFELTSEPMSMFKENMRKPDKPSLRKVLLPDSLSHTLEEIDKQMTSIIDGGALLHKVRWKKGMKFLEIGNLYVKYIENHYKHV